MICSPKSHLKKIVFYNGTAEKNQYAYYTVILIEFLYGLNKTLKWETKNWN